ncbi:MAG: DUF4391 domain-containing protein [Verrucomicrobiota bacterium]|jgi:hypothetical protein
MFSFPTQSEFNRPLPKSKIYAFAKPTRAVKNRMVSGIEDMVWRYKLAPETVNLPARHGIHEIQVFDIALKTPEISDDVLLTIDKAIPSPIVYQITFDHRVRFSAAYKRPSDTDGSKNVIEAYFTTDWQPSGQTYPPLPMVLDLAALHEEMLCRIIPLTRRQGETLQALVDRAMQVRAKERECRILEARLQKEPQFNRKVEINCALRCLREELKTLA